ncbi:Predicted esterase [Escherichia coli]|uniref:Predicted esterase n=1 Tax=Escherichia coli TaxID=562 RepID=A0A376PWZ1_ECOLX|nr:Predicted esterase [Escherichia coli]
MIIYLHGFDSNSPGNHEKVLQLQFIDPDVRLISYSTRHPKHDMQHLLKEVDKMLQLNVDERPLICGVGLGGYWAERIGFLCDIRQVIFNPNLFPYENMEGKIDRPEEYADIATKCVTNFREKNRDRCLVICRVMMKRLTASGHLKSCIIITRLSGTKSRRTNSRISPRIYSALKRSKPSGKCPRRIR